ncbi:hypothetical protein ACFOTA_12040 [Chitinophaga sp. GCM10012297]|uniref:Uncharacterized protein n=1 Tax=Chitinophaga chungangae TaxID=2821488 RepID=A0ABS3YE47_9BACT|nr:hypothetical protein [Chitinophaga chungangae]MBO9152941.1 hypothetical protein [Chitinophaga chungangae]
MNSISELTQEYTAVLQKVQERRACWQAKSKPFLIQFLSGVTEKHKLNWKAGANELMLGLEAVYLVFDHEPSGIVEQSPFSIVQKMKIGGILSFSQTRNGQIVVWISYPFIDGMAEDKPKNDTLETIEPEEITEENVTRYIQKFLVEIIEWENNARDEIGFVRHR